MGSIFRLIQASGSDVRKIEGGERTRLVPVSERFILNAGGTLGPLTEGSTQATTLLVHNAGITPVLRFVFEIPQALAR
jgi:hypothetical protein